MSMHLGDNVPSVKRRNRALILELILRNNPIARVTLAEITGLSRAAVSTITGELLDADIIVETGETAEGKRSVGRAPVYLDVNARIGGVIAIDITNTGITGALINLKSGIEQEVTRPLADIADPALVLALTNECIAQLLADAQACGKRVMGIGVSLSGLIDPFSGVVFSSSTMGWRKVNVIEALRIHGDLPVIIDSNVRTMVLAEHLFGVGRGVSNMALIYIGTGIGCGIIMNDEVYAGSANRAGEIGHTTIAGAENTVCACGNRGCLEAVASERALSRLVAEMLQTGRPSSLRSIAAGGSGGQIAAEKVAMAAVQGDELAREIIGRVSGYLGSAIANLVNWYDPRLVVLAGGVTAAGETLLASIREVVAARALEGSAPPQITISRFGHHVGVVGAGALALRELVYSPRLDLPGEVRVENGTEPAILQPRLLRLTINRG